jgi:YQGE family putative transporter
MALFISFVYLISEDFALKYALVIVGAVQLLSLPLAKNIIREIDHDLVSLERE